MDTTEITLDISDSSTEVSLDIDNIVNMVVGEGKMAKFIKREPFEITVDDFAGVEEIPDYLFHRSSLSSIRLPLTIKKIGQYAFAYTNIQSISIPNTVTSFGAEICMSCKKLTRVELQNGLTKIAERLLMYCTELTEIEIPDSVTSIESSAFNGCSKLDFVVVPKNVTSIGSLAFSMGSSSNKKTYTILPTTPPTIQSNAFSKSYTQKIIVPKGCLSAYQTATNWSSLASLMVEAEE